MNKTRLVFSTLTVAGMLLVTASTIAMASGPGPRFAAGGFGGPGFDGPQMAERLIRFLDLEGEQRDEVRQIIDNARPELRELSDAMRDSRSELRELAEADTLDTAALRSAADQTGDLMADIIVVGVGVMNEVRAVLTPEQLEELEERLEERGHGRRFGRR